MGLRFPTDWLPDGVNAAGLRPHLVARGVWFISVVLAMYKVADLWRMLCSSRR